MHLDESGLVLAADKGGTGGAMGLVTQDEVELLARGALGLGDDIDGLIGGEHHNHLLAPATTDRHLFGKPGRVRGGDGDVVGGDVLGLPGSPGVGANHHGPDSRLGLGHPFLQGLRNQGDGGGQEEYLEPTAILGAQLFCELQ